MAILKFRIRGRKKGSEPGKLLVRPIPPAVPGITTATRYCFEIINSALKQDNKDEVTKNLLTWFVDNSSHNTLTKFIVWVVEKENK